MLELQQTVKSAENRPNVMVKVCAGTKIMSVVGQVRCAEGGKSVFSIGTKR